jgi:HupE / UreJ protein
MPFRTWTRPALGPLTLIVGWIVVAGAVVQAHDPGLSSLDVRATDNAIVTSLSLSAADVAVAAAGRETRAALIELARDGVHISVDGTDTPSHLVDVAVDQGGSRIDQSFAIPIDRQSHRIEITSTVANRLARGHRQLLVVHANNRPVLERLLDEHSSPISVDVDAITSSPLQIARHYLALGVHHILTGYDHLVFLAGLILTARRIRQLLITLTAFTVAHSISLALVMIGGVRAPSAIVEPLIALSIAWVGLDILLSDARRVPVDQSSTDRRGARWLVVFGFGLIHGFGFAGALMELGLGSSTSAIATALVSFNLGVEAGQVMVAAVLTPVVWLTRTRPTLHTRMVRVCSLAVMIAGTYWLIDRLR